MKGWGPGGLLLAARGGVVGLLPGLPGPGHACRLRVLAHAVGFHDFDFHGSLLPADDFGLHGFLISDHEFGFNESLPLADEFGFRDGSLILAYEFGLGPRAHVPEPDEAAEHVGGRLPEGRV